MAREAELHKHLVVNHVSYPRDAPTVVIEIWGHVGPLPEAAVSSIEACIGAFDISEVDG